MLTLSLKDYLLMVEATQKSYGLMERLYGFMAEALERLDVLSHSKNPSRLQPMMQSMKTIITQSACCTKGWQAVLSSIALELRTADSMRLLFAKVLGADCVAPILRLMDYSCFIHDHQNSNAFLKGQQPILKKGIGWIAEHQSFDKPQRQLLGVIHSSIESIDRLLEANRKLDVMVQAFIQGTLDQDRSYEQGFQNLLQHCQRRSSPAPQEGLLEVHAAFMDRVLGRLQPLSRVQGPAQTGESHV